MTTEPPPASASSASVTAAADGTAAPSAPLPAPPTKIDPVTQVQDAIDGLALSLFEALRGIRDATAPEALVGEASTNNANNATNNTNGSKGGTSTSSQDEADFDDFLIAYHNQDPHALEVAQKAGGKPPQSKEEYLKVLARMDFESDVGTAQRLAGEILAKSREVEELVDDLPGMGRSKEEQMDRIAALIEENRTVDRQLEEKHREASERRDEVRTMLREVTCSALGIEEE